MREQGDILSPLVLPSCCDVSSLVNLLRIQKMWQHTSVLSEDCVSVLPLVCPWLEITTTDILGDSRMNITDGPGQYWVHCISRCTPNFVICFFYLWLNHSGLHLFLLNQPGTEPKIPSVQIWKWKRWVFVALLGRNTRLVHLISCSLYIQICTEQADLRKSFLILTNDHQVCSCPKIDSRWEFGCVFIIHVGRRPKQKKGKKLYVTMTRGF